MIKVKMPYYDAKEMEAKQYELGERVLEYVANKFVEHMADYVRTSSADAPQRWKNMIARDLKILSAPKVDGSLVTIEAGLPYEPDPTDYKWMRTMVIIYGVSGIEAGPYGRVVWDSDLNRQGTSHVNSEVGIPLPDSWAHEGHDFFTEGCRIFRTMYSSWLAEALAKIPKHFFDSCIKWR